MQREAATWTNEEIQNGRLPHCIDLPGRPRIATLGRYLSTERRRSKAVRRLCVNDAFSIAIRASMTHNHDMERPLHTVAETPGFIATAAKAGMTDAEREAAVLQIASDPAGGDLVVGSGGVRKVRVAGRGFGKSGGYRVATAFLNLNRPVYLLAVLSKGKAANFTAAQIKMLKALTDRLRGAKS